MKTIFLIFPTLIIVSLYSCSDDENISDIKLNPVSVELVGKTFNHLFFETEQACIAAQSSPDFFINCHQQLTFIDAEQATIMITDIMNRAKYSVHDGKITIVPEPNSEFSKEIVFEIINSNTLQQLDSDIIWKEQTGGFIWE